MNKKRAQFRHFAQSYTPLCRVRRTTRLSPLVATAVVVMSRHCPSIGWSRGCVGPNVRRTTHTPRGVTRISVTTYSTTVNREGGRWSTCHSIVGSTAHDNGLPPVEVPGRSLVSHVSVSSVNQSPTALHIETLNGPLDRNPDENGTRPSPHTSQLGTLNSEGDEPYTAGSPPTEGTNIAHQASLRKIAWFAPELRRRNAICSELENETIMADGASLAARRRHLASVTRFFNISGI